MENELFEAVLDVLSKEQAMTLKAWLANVLNEQALSKLGRANITTAHDLVKLDEWSSKE